MHTAHAFLDITAKSSDVLDTKSSNVIKLFMSQISEVNN